MTLTALKSVPQTLPEDFEAIFLAHHDLIYRTAYRITGNAEDAEDVLQTLFLRLLRRETPPNIGKNPKGYLHRAAVNISLDILKIRNRSVSSAEIEPRLEDPGCSSAQQPSRTDIQDWLRGGLSELSPRSAEIFILRHIEGYGNAEIAKLLGTSRGTVAVMLFRVRNQLKKSLRIHFGETL